MKSCENERLREMREEERLEEREKDRTKDRRDKRSASIFGPLAAKVQNAIDDT